MEGINKNEKLNDSRSILVENKEKGAGVEYPYERSLEIKGNLKDFFKEYIKEGEEIYLDGNFFRGKLLKNDGKLMERLMEIRSSVACFSEKNEKVQQFNFSIPTSLDEIENLNLDKFEVTSIPRGYQYKVINGYNFEKIGSNLIEYIKNKTKENPGEIEFGFGDKDNSDKFLDLLKESEITFSPDNTELFIKK